MPTKRFWTSVFVGLAALPMAVGASAPNDFLVRIDAPKAAALPGCRGEKCPPHPQGLSTGGLPTQGGVSAGGLPGIRPCGSSPPGAPSGTASLSPPKPWSKPCD